MKTKILTKKEIPELEEGQEVIIKKLNYGEKSDLSDKTTTIETKGNVPTVKISTGATRTFTLLYSIIKCPWYQDNFPEEQKIHAIRNLEEETGTAILEAIKGLDSSIKGDVLKKSDRLPVDSK